jgi:hypothetical protein
MEEHLSDQQIIELSKKKPHEVFSCEDGRVAIGGRILAKEEAQQLEQQAQALKDFQENPKAAHLALKIANAIDLFNPRLWFKNKKH